MKDRIKSYPRYKFVLALIDLIIVNAGFYLTALIINEFLPKYADRNLVDFSFYTQFVIYSLFTIFYFQYSNLYKIQFIFKPRLHFITLFKSIVVIIVGVILFQFLLKDIRIVSRVYYSLLFVNLIILFSSIRVPLVRVFENFSIVNNKVIIIGTGDKAKTLWKIFRYKMRVNKVVGFISNDDVDHETIKGVPVLGKIEDIPEIAEKLGINVFILATDELNRRNFFEIFNFFQENNLTLSVSSEYFEGLNDKIDIDIFEEFGIIPFYYNNHYRIIKYFKRLFDVTFSLIGILLLSPLFILIGILVKFSSKGPIIYKQIRIGKHGRPFSFYKFRSMYVNSDKDVKRELDMSNFIKGKIGTNDTSSTKIVNTSNITKIGSIIRKYSLDELPQLFNVLKGEMSLVGPRPCLKSEWDVYEDWQRLRLNSLPGCTGIWQVSGRSNVSFEDSVLMDIYYIQNGTPWMDLKIILKTIPVMVFAKGGE